MTLLVVESVDTTTRSVSQLRRPKKSAPVWFPLEPTLLCATIPPSCPKIGPIHGTRKSGIGMMISGKAKNHGTTWDMASPRSSTSQDSKWKTTATMYDDEPVYGLKFHKTVQPTAWSRRKNICGLVPKKLKKIPLDLLKKIVPKQLVTLLPKNGERQQQFWEPAPRQNPNGDWMLGWDVQTRLHHPKHRWRKK